MEKTYKSIPIIIRIKAAKNNIVPDIATDSIPRIRTGILFPLLIADVALKCLID